MSTSKIEWTEIPSYNGYFVSKNGLIKGPSNKILNPMKMPSGHLYIFARRPNVPRKLFVHRAVLITYGRKSLKGEEVRHLNGIPADNRLINLAWGTKYDQREDDKRNGINRYKNRVFNFIQIKKIRFLKNKKSSRKVAELFNTSHTTIQKIWRNERYV